MPYQPINYANIPVQENRALSDFSSTFARALEAATLPRRRRADMQRQDLENALLQVKSTYSPQMMEAELGKLQRGAEFAPDPFTRALQGAELAKQQYGPESEQARMFADYLSQMSQGKDGIQVAFDPISKQPIINIGGKSKGGAGVMQAGNELISPLTTQQQSRAQRQIAGEKSFERYAEEMKNLGKYRTAPAKATRALQGLANMFGAQFESPSEYASALGATELGAEALLGAYGLPSTEKTIARLADVLKPNRGESGEGYMSRINKLEEFVKAGGKQAVQDLMAGIRSPIEEIGETDISEEFELSVNDPDVQFTANKYGITPEEVVARLRK